MNEYSQDKQPFKFYLVIINYSIFMTANPSDADAAQKAYAKVQVSEIMPFGKFVKHIADHISKGGVLVYSYSEIVFIKRRVASNRGDRLSFIVS